jgi:RNA polymerase sigma factor (sigma-70 family)
MACMETSPEKDETEARFEGHLALAQIIALEYCNIPRALPEEALSEAQMALWRAANAYNPERGEFPAYASRAIRNSLNSLYAKQLKLAEVFPKSLDDAPAWKSTIESSSSTEDVSPKAKITDSKQDVRKSVQWEETSNILAIVLKHLNLRERVVIEAIRSGYSYSEIGTKLKVSKQTAHKIATGALQKIRANLSSLGYTGIDSVGLLKGFKSQSMG